MTSIHAVVPSDLKDAVKAAKHRGEDPSSIREEQDDDIPQQRRRKQQRLQTGTTRKSSRKPTTQPSPNPEPPTTHQTPDDPASDSENDNPASASKENDPSLSPTPVRQATPASPRKSALGKRPLSVLAVSYQEDPDADMMLVDSEEPHSATMTTSEQNISANRCARSPISPVRKSPKLTLSKGTNASASFRHRDDLDLQIYEDVPDRTVNEFTSRFSGDGKENRDSAGGGLNAKGKGGLQTAKATTAGANVPTTGQTPAMSRSAKSPSLSTSSSSKVSKKVVGNGARKVSAPKAKPRIGIRRL